MSNLQKAILGLAIALYVVWRVNMLVAGYRKQRGRTGASSQPAPPANTNSLQR